MITKNSTTAELRILKEQIFKQHGVELRFIDQRNAEGEINNLEFYFFEKDKEIGTLGLGLYDPAVIETSTFFFTQERHFGFWNATKNKELLKTQAAKRHYQDSYIKGMNELVPASTNFKFLITKDTTDEELNAIKKTLKELYSTAFTFKVTRNNENEIIAISMTHDDNKGNTGNYNSNDGVPIKKVTFYKTEKRMGFATINDTKQLQKIGQDEKTRVSEKVVLAEKQLKNEEAKKRAEILEKSQDLNSFNENSQRAFNYRETHNVATIDGKEPLYVINGEEIGYVLGDIDPEDIASIDILKGENATKRFGPKGQNGVVMITLKNVENFRNETKKKGLFERFENLQKNGNNQPLFIVDGIEMDQASATKSLLPENIESMTILQEKHQTEKYGEKGKNGVVLITLKKKE